MKLYNGGQILKNNTVYLKWETADKNYRQGLLFRLADNYLSKQLYDLLIILKLNSYS